MASQIDGSLGSTTFGVGENGGLRGGDLGFWFSWLLFVKDFPVFNAEGLEAPLASLGLLRGPASEAGVLARTGCSGVRPRPPNCVDSSAVRARISLSQPSGYQLAFALESGLGLVSD